MTEHPKTKPYLPSEEETSAQIQRFEASPDFKASPQQIALLKYVVEQTLAGRADRIKGYTVATEVFGRQADFDQNIDPIVSIQASRLRRALAHYYDEDGINDPLQIEIPKGTYVPEFKRHQTPATVSATTNKIIGIAVKSSWPAVIVRPLKNISRDPELDHWGIGLATELANELNRYSDIRVMTLHADRPESAIDPDAVQFSISGNVRRDRTVIKISVRLTALQTGRLIWSESYRAPNEAGNLIACQEEIARSVAVKIAGENGHIAKTLKSRFKGRPPKHMDAYEAVLRYYEYNLNYTPKAFASALAALEKAVRIDPECGQVWAMRARLYASVYAFDIPGYQNPLATALESALHGVRLSPIDQRAGVILTFVHLLRNDLPAGLAEAKRALELGPASLFMLDGIGYLLTLLGDWERGPALIHDVIQLNPFYGNYVHYALWVDRLRQADYEGALQETLKLNQPALFWDHLARAASLGLLGQIDDGRRAAAELLKLKPDFEERGRFLIQCYIKFDDIVEQVIIGLAAVGVDVK